MKSKMPVILVVSDKKRFKLFSNNNDKAKSALKSGLLYRKQDENERISAF